MSTSPIYSTASLRHFVAQFVACTFVASAVVLGGCAVDSTAPRSAITAPNAAVQADIQADAGDGSGQRFLIADQFNNRVIEVDRTGNILWSDNRVLLVDPSGTIVWQYGQFGVTGAGRNELNAPVQNTYLPNGHVLITDQGNERVIEVDRRSKAIVWQYGTTGVIGSGFNQLNNPNSAELLDNGHVLISDENNNRAIEVNRAHQVLATYTARGTVSGVAFASRLPNGHTLITDSNNNRIVEVDATDRIVWEYATNTAPKSNPNPLPTRAVRLADGGTLISDQFNHRVIVVDSAKKIVRTFGNLNVAGYGTRNTSQGLNGPYDAKVIGDFTGLTSPFNQGGNE